MNATKYLTVKECCERLGLKKPDRIRNAIKQGLLRARAVGEGTVRRRWRITEAAFQEFEASLAYVPPAKVQRAARKREQELVTKYF